MTPPTHLFGFNSQGAGCGEESKTLARDDTEKAQMPCDAFQDAILMDAAERRLRQVPVEIAGLEFPKRPAA